MVIVVCPYSFRFRFVLSCLSLTHVSYFSLPWLGVGVNEGVVGEGGTVGERAGVGEEDGVDEGTGVGVGVEAGIGVQAAGGVEAGGGVAAGVIPLGAGKPGAETGGTGIVCCPFTLIVAREMNTAIPKIATMMMMIVSVT
jgi:hypothetical protein